MSDAYKPGYHDCDPRECDPHDWGPHGPDGMYVPRYVWPDVYHPVPYGKEYEGNENLTLDGEHWCPPRDHGRHDCPPDDPCHRHSCMNFTDLLKDYMDMADKYLHATSYQERKDCEEELREIKAKLDLFWKQSNDRDNKNMAAINRLSQKINYYVERFQEMASAYNELDETVKEIGLQDYYTKAEVDTMVPKLTFSGKSLIIS